MGDWRAMGQGIRRRMGQPSAHSQGARNPSQLPRFVNPPEAEGRIAGRPEGTTKNNSFWDSARRQESAAEARAGEDQWTRQLKARVSENHPSMKHKRMKRQNDFFG